MDSDTTALRWPSSPDDLIDTGLCPVCFTAVTVERCPECGLTLTDDRLQAVLLLGREVHLAEQDRRRALVDVRAAQRHETARAEAARRAAERRELESAQHATASALAARLAGAPPAAPAAPSGPASPAASAPRPMPPAPRPARTRPRISVPVLLLIIGVCLVGVAAIFFLTVAWFVASIEVRALIIGGVTVATLVTASLLRRRRLEATAEAIAVIGVLLLALDAWAVRANGLFGADGLTATLYAGIATLAVSVIARLWSWLSTLRAPDIASVLGVPVGIALVVGGAAALPVGSATVLAFVAAAAGGLLHTLPAPWSAARPTARAERTALAAIGVTALIAAAVTSPFVGLDDPWFAVWSTAAAVVVAAMSARVLRRPLWGEPLAWAPPLRTGAISTGVALASALGWQLALRDDAEVFVSVCAPVIAVAVLVAVLRGRRLLDIPFPAVVIATIAAALSVVAVALLWLYAGATVITGTWSIWLTDPLQAPIDPDAWVPLVGAALVSALLWLVPTDAAPGVRAVRAGVAATLVLTAAAVTGTPLLMVGLAGLVCAAAVVLGRRRPDDVAGWAVPAALGGAAAYTAGIATPWLWIVGIGIAVTTALALAALLRASDAVRASLVAVGVGIAALSALLAPQAIAAMIGATGQAQGTGLAAFALLQWLAVTTLLIAIVAPAVALGGALRRVLAIEGLSIAAVSLIPTVLTAFPATAQIVEDGVVAQAIGEPWAGLVRGALLLAVLGATAWSRVRGGFTGGTPAVAALLLAPTAGAVIVAVCRIADAPDAAPPLATAAFAALCIASAVAAVRGADQPTVVRRAADGGAMIATALVAWQARSDLAWLVLLLIAVAIGATSATRGWAAPRVATIAGVPTAPMSGAPLASAPRRLLAWPAFGFAVAALWAALADAARRGGEPTLEAYTIAPAIGLVLFAAALTWLRRHPEAVVATALGVSLGVLVPAVWIIEHSPARTITATLVGAALAGAFAWTSARRLIGVSVAGAVSALAAATGGALAMSQWTGALHPLWTALPVAVAFASALGFVRGRDSRSDAGNLAAAQRRFVSAAPATTILLGALGVALPLSWRDDGDLAGAIALAVLLLLTVVAAAVGIAPLSTATRWSAAAGAVLIAALLLPRADAVELISLPFGLALLAGAALAMRRRDRTGDAWPAGESVAWLAGIVVTVLPSVIAAPTTGRSWLLVAACLLAATGLAAVTAPRTATLATASIVVLLGAVAIAAGRAVISLPLPASFAIPVVAGAGIAAVGAVAVWRRLGPPALSVGAGAVGSAVIAGTVAARADGSVTNALVVAALGAVAAVVAASALARPGWRPFAGTLAIGATLVALTGIGSRLWPLMVDGSQSFEIDAWVLGGCGVVVAVGLAALRTDKDIDGAGDGRPDARTVVATVSGLAFAASAAFLALIESALISSSATPNGLVRAAATATLLSAAIVGGALARPRIGVALFGTAVAGAALVAAVAWYVGAADPVEVVTVPPALALLALGARRMRRDEHVRSWPALGVGLALLTVPSLAQDLGPNELWRIVALGLVSLGLVVLGAMRRLQAPLVIGSVVLVVHAVAQLWPWISSSYTAVPWWLWVGLGGILLIVIAARYERQLAALRSAYASVTALR